MKAAPFRYVAPASLDEALAALAAGGDDAKVIAGGQSLVPLMAGRLVRPAILVDIGGVGEVASTTLDGPIAIGAGVRQRAAERDRALAAACPLLPEALAYVAHPPIRNRGTVVGSLAHADPAAELPAVMAALDAVVVARSVRGERRIAAHDFFVSYLTTALDDDEIVTRVELPPSPPRSGHAFVELSRRHGDFALVGCAARLVLDADRRVVDARLAFCGVGSTPVRAWGVETALAGATIGDAGLEDAVALLAGDLDPGSDLHATAAYRRHVARELACRALRACAARAEAA